MSGNSNDGGGPSISRPSSNDNCDDLVIVLNLASPQAEVINTLNKGDVLSVQPLTEQGPIQVLDYEGHVAGTIVSREMVRLLNCINNGTDFGAEVLQINGGQCNVRIFAI